MMTFSFYVFTSLSWLSLITLMFSSFFSWYRVCISRLPLLALCPCCSLPPGLVKPLTSPLGCVRSLYRVSQKDVYTFTSVLNGSVNSFVRLLFSVVAKSCTNQPGMVFDVPGSSMPEEESCNRWSISRTEQVSFDFFLSFLHFENILKYRGYPPSATRRAKWPAIIGQRISGR